MGVFAARRIAEQSRRTLGEVLPALFDGRQPQPPLITADDYPRRFQALDAKLAACPHARDRGLRGWIDLVKGSLFLELTQKERIAEGAAGLGKTQYDRLRQWLVYEATRWHGLVADGDLAKVQAAVLSGAFFPDCPDAKLAYQQIIAEFSDAPGTLWFAVGLMAGRHRDEWTERLYRTATEFDPKDARHWNYLGNLLKDHTDRDQEAEAASEDNTLALSRIQEQARECHAMGLGTLLADLIDASEYADLLCPIGLAPRAAHSGNQAFDGIPAEIRGMAEESLADIQRRA